MRRRPVLPLALLALLLLVMSALPTAAGAGADEIGDKAQQAKDVAAQLDELNLKLMDLAARQEVAHQKLDEATAQASEASRALDAANVDLDAHRQALTEFAVQAYISGGSSQVDDILADPSPQGAVATGYLASVGHEQQQLIDQLASTKERVSSESERLHHAQDEATQLNEQLAKDLDETNTALASQQELKDHIDLELSMLVAAEQKRVQDEANAMIAIAQAQAVGGAIPEGLAPAPNPQAAAAVRAAMSKIGSPYIWGAAGPDTFDCSGLTMWAWAQAGVTLGHYTGIQYAQTAHIAMADLQPGDLVFYWAPGEGDPGHVGMYIGRGIMVHAPHAGSFVQLSPITYWPRATMAAARVV